ncbi:hypothetical protein F4808DRAFT_393599 [Astrocystis sublimbata]|nr:hypothetical protein F4808DRAFT_393599 [Astrocystis sublimbata]
MPPKRQRQETIDLDSESDKAAPGSLNGSDPLPTIMRNINDLKTKRNSERSDIVARFNTYVNKEQSQLKHRFASEVERREAEHKDVLARYAQALEQRALIEAAIEKILLDTREDLTGLEVALGAVYTGRQQRAHAAAGSFASYQPAPATTTIAETPTKHGTGPCMHSEAHIAQAEKEGGHGDEGKTYAGKENVLNDDISW